MHRMPVRVFAVMQICHCIGANAYRRVPVCINAGRSASQRAASIVHSAHPKTPTRPAPTPG